MAWVISAVGVALFFSYFALESTSSSIIPESFNSVVITIVSLVALSILVVLYRKILSFLNTPQPEYEMANESEDEENRDEMEEPLDNVADRNLYHKNQYSQELY